MKIAIVGAGNMGGAIARAIAKDKLSDHDLMVANPSPAKLQTLQQCHPSIATTSSNTEAVAGADIVVLAVKPWILPGVMSQLADTLDHHQMIVSVAGGVSIDALRDMLPATENRPEALFHVIPDTAIAVGHGMTFIAAEGAQPHQIEAVKGLFATMGEVAIIDESLMGAATALSSCGIAYAFKYIQASVQAGVELGFKPADALRYTVATVDGAVAMLKDNPQSIPQMEIDKVTTPGGMTIRGINTLERKGFTPAVIDAILAPLKKL